MDQSDTIICSLCTTSGPKKFINEIRSETKAICISSKKQKVPFHQEVFKLKIVNWIVFVFRCQQNKNVKGIVLSNHNKTCIKSFSFKLQPQKYKKLLIMQTQWLRNETTKWSRLSFKIIWEIKTKIRTISLAFLPEKTFLLDFA